MTHGEELCSEMHQDSVVLTYLESVLMHRASGGSVGNPPAKRTSDEEGAACKTSTSRSSSSSGGGGGGGGGEGLAASPARDPPVPSHQRASKAASALNVKKARLLQAEAWDGAKRRRVCGHGLEPSEQEAGLATDRPGALGKTQQQHSTLLASLLQSFSSRLQNVALSQHGNAPRAGQLGSPASRESPPEEDLRSYGLVSSHLRALLKNRDHSRAHCPVPMDSEGLYHSPVDNQRLSSSPQVPCEGRAPSGEPVSCAARLRAVASLVENGPRPPSSPKPSVACSQLALLLSSDTQLQQYSREHSLGPRAAPPSASERLAAIASQKACEPSTAHIGQERPPTTRSRGSPPNGAMAGASKSQPGPSDRSGGFGDQASREKGGRERWNRSPMSPNSSSSLLMHLLNTNSVPKSSPSNGAQCANGHRWNGPERRNIGGFDYRSHLPAWEKPVKLEPGSLEEVYSSDESSRSSCTPMDLSTKPRICEPISLHSRSLEQMTESLLFSWNPKIPGVRGPEVKEERNGPESKCHQKVTLLQLLLGHQNGTKGNRTPEPQAPDLKTEVPNSAATQTESSMAALVLSRRASIMETFPSSSSSSSSSSLSSSLPLVERSPAATTVCGPASASRQAQLPPVCNSSDCASRTFAQQGKASGSPVEGESSKNHQPFLKQLAPAEPVRNHHFPEQPLVSESATVHQFPKQLLSMELAKSNQYVPLQSLASESRLSNFSFSASKLLQDLAHTGFHKSPEASQMDTEHKNVALGPVEMRAGETSGSLFGRPADPLCLQQSGLHEPSVPHDRQARQAGSTPNVDMENLLERHSVLQLLLRTPEKDKVLKRHLHERPDNRSTSADVQPPSGCCNGDAIFTQPISMVKVKTEPVEEEDGFTPNTQALLEGRANCPLPVPTRAEEQHPPFLLENVKQEMVSPPLSPSPALSHSSQKGGVLSQLLLRHNVGTSESYTAVRHQNTGNPGSHLELQVPTSGSNSPCNIPKKRKILPTSPTELDDFQKTLDQTEVLNGHTSSSREASNGLPAQDPSSKASGTLLDFRSGDGVEFESRSYLKDTQGFNVLKQLLLSENGIKVLSQHRTLQNGGLAGEGINLVSHCDQKPEDGNSTHFYSKHELDSSGKETSRGLEHAGYPNSLPSRSPADYPMGSSGPRLESARFGPDLPTVRAAADSERWVPFRGERQGPQADSPWLTKTNPILYYMLQRGGGGGGLCHSFGLSAPRGGAGEADMAKKERRRQRRRSELRDRPGRSKEEEPAVCENHLGCLRGRDPPLPNSSEGGRGILETVTAIKREPD